MSKEYVKYGIERIEGSGDNDNSLPTPLNHSKHSRL